MRKLSLKTLSVYCLSCLCAITAAGQDNSTKNVTIYYQDGFDRSDGMMVVIDLDRQVLLDVGMVTNLKRCPTNDAKICFISQPLTFSSRKYKNTRQWDEGGYHFFEHPCVDRQGICKTFEVSVAVITSHQESKDLWFYYNDAKGLLGWTAKYNQPDGSVATETWRVLRLLPDRSQKKGE